jgi:hypothetical protein
VRVRAYRDRVALRREKPDLEERFSIPTRDPRKALKVLLGAAKPHDEPKPKDADADDQSGSDGSGP